MTKEPLGSRSVLFCSTRGKELGWSLGNEITEKSFSGKAHTRYPVCHGAFFFFRSSEVQGRGRIEKKPGFQLYLMFFCLGGGVFVFLRKDL